MAQVFKDFQSDPLGNVPEGMVLRRSAVSSEYQIAENGGTKFLKYLSVAAISAKGLSYLGAPSSGVTEIYAEIRDIDTSNPASARVVLFASDGPDNEYGVYYDRGTNRIDLYSRVAGNFNVVSRLTTESGLFPTTEYYHVLFKVIPAIAPETRNGLFVKFWKQDVPEPETWTIETDSSALTLSTGWSGHVGFAQNDEVRYRAIGIGTNNDPAPRQALTTGNQIILATAINSAEQFGTADVIAGPVSIQFTGILSEALVSELVLSSGSSDIFAQAIVSETVVATPSLVAGPVSIHLSAIPSEESVSPMAFYAGGSAIFADGIDSLEQFGDSSFIPGPVSISVVAIDSDAIVSSPELLAGPAVIYAGSVPSAELFGDLDVFNVQQLIRLDGISTAEAFGSTTLEGGADISGWLTGRLNIKPALTASVGVNRVH